jgi:hypothetical protein
MIDVDVSGTLVSFTGVPSDGPDALQPVTD